MTVDYYKHVPSSCTLSELTQNDILCKNNSNIGICKASTPTTTTTNTPQTTSSSSSSESTSLDLNLNRHLNTNKTECNLSISDNDDDDDDDDVDVDDNNNNNYLNDDIDNIENFKLKSNAQFNKFYLNNKNHNNIEMNKINDKSIDYDIKYNININYKRNYLIIILLLVVNLLNYADRFSIAGVLREIQYYYKINNAAAGLLQTVFICSYMLLAPLFGYLGDRYNRKAIIIFGITFWSLMTLLGSFVPPNHFWLFVIIRSLVGVGEASYSCVAPTIIGDLFTNEMRTRMLGIFYLAVPVGSGLGYVIGSNVANAFGDWRWALRVTPPLGFICIILLIFLVEEPKRGGAEGSKIQTSRSSFLADVVYLLKNKSFMWTTFGFTFGAFVMGGLSWWIPTFVEYAIYSINETPKQIPLLFGLITCVAGLVGVCASSLIAPRMRIKTKRADPLICAFGSLIAVPTLFICILVPRYINMILFWFIVAIGISGMCLCWTLVADITLYVVEPTRRSIASALNILICHLLGDAISPYIIGTISDSLRGNLPDTYYNRFTTLQVALYAGPFFAALSFAAYLFAAIYIEEDKKLVEVFIENQKKFEDNSQRVPLNPSSEEASTATSNSCSSDQISNENESITKDERKKSTTSLTSLTIAAKHHLSKKHHIINIDDEAHINPNYNHSNSSTMANLLEGNK